MAELQQNRYDQLLRRVGDLKGPGAKVADALSELFPTIDLEDPPSELQLLGGTVLGMGASTLVGAAGETAKIQVFNPADSGKLVTVTHVLITSTSTGTGRLAVATASLASGIGTQVVRDTRKGIIQRPTAAMFQESSAGIVNSNMIFALLADTDLTIQDRKGLFVLSPGTGLTAGHGTVAVRLTCTFLWRERAAEPSELNF